MRRARAIAENLLQIEVGDLLVFDLSKEATFNHYEDLSRINKDASIKAAVNSAKKILEKK